LKQVFIKISYNNVKEKRSVKTMDNRNTYNTQPNNFYSYGGYPAATASLIRPEVPNYMLPQAVPAAILKGRPVSSYEEARVAQIDLDGSIFIFPDLGNKRIYTKKINIDGTASFNTYSLEERPIEAIAALEAPVSREEFNELKKSVETLLSQLT
jgi:hypothetical protein